MSTGFVVSARKYRPQRFDEVVGQETTTITLKNAIVSGHLAHSFLFCGPRGVGKTTIARILAKTINCKNLQEDGEACNNCDSCISFNNNSNFNIIELDAASRNKVEDARGLIEQTNYAPQNSKYKVFIIDEVHMLSGSAFNALLKTLEEPPSYAKFILATTEKHKILPTILSRCQIYDFKRISVPNIEQHLKSIAIKESIVADDKALNIIAQKADGGLRDALSMFDRLVSIHNDKLMYEDVLSNLNILDFDYYFKFTEYILTENSADIMLMLDAILDKGFDLESLMSGFSEHLRNLWMAKKDNTMLLINYTADIKHRFGAQAALCSVSLIMNLIQLVSEGESSLAYAKNKRLSVEITLLKMCYVQKVMNTSWLSMEDEKKKSSLIDNSPSAPIVIAQIPVSNKKSNEIAPTTSNNTTNGLVIDDLLKNIEDKIKVPELVEKLYANIPNPDTIWSQIKEKYDGPKSEKFIIDALTPKIVGDTFTFAAYNSIQQTQLESKYVKLDAIYNQLTNLNAKWTCVVDTSLEPIVDVESKVEQYKKIAEIYPILNVLKMEFAFDLYLD